MFHKKNLAYCTALKASSKSSMISSIFSVPIDRRIVLGLIPDPNNSSSVIWECVVDAGWMTKDFTSATFASSENNSKWSIKSFAFCASPLISNVKIDPPPLGKYFLYNSCCSGSSDTDGWFTFSTAGWFFRYSTTFNAFCTWRSTLKDNVSNPCKKMNAWTGDNVAPVSRSNNALIFVTNAAAPTSFVKLTPW